MRRRDLLRLLAAAPVVVQNAIPTVSTPLIKPRALKPGDTVGLITPATYVSDPERLEFAARTMQYFGLKTRFGRNAGRRFGYLGGTVEERLDDLHAMFADPEVKAVIPIRGGYGAGQLVDRIDYDLIRRNPKVFAGFSDITALHLAIHKMTGLVTFHSPVPVSPFTSFTIERYRNALFDPAPIGVVDNPPEANQLRPAHSMSTVRGGKATGRLVGGNLFLVCELMGTPYEIDTRGKILFLEDVGEEAYRIDRIFTQLRLAGKLQQCAGYCMGRVRAMRPARLPARFRIHLLRR